MALPMGVMATLFDIEEQGCSWPVDRGLFFGCIWNNMSVHHETGWNCTVDKPPPPPFAAEAR
ncbi:hypothetical protein CEP54_003237 [Fusarium duplospermum]|uniref:Uncharacterized protein n=1 Tax=Fusarium duplospermum TaxID=1325734 RepID=A0A428QQF2_9HYPO|nr:hypothetical protein CEP54_003237 [Fusarium duplospermum]